LAAADTALGGHGRIYWGPYRGDTEPAEVAMAHW